MDTVIKLMSIWFAASVAVGIVYSIFMARYDERQEESARRFMRDKKTILGL